MRDRVAAFLVKRLFGKGEQAWLTPIMARALPGVGLVLATSLLAAALGLVTPWLTKLLIDRGLVAQDWDAVLRYVELVFFVGLATLAGSIGNSLLHLHLSARMLSDLRARLLDAALHRRIDRPPLRVGEALSRLDGDTAEIQRFAFDTTLATASSLFRLIGGTVMLFVLDWRLALIPVVAAPVNLVFLAWARPGSRMRADDLRTARGELTTHMVESFTGLPTLRTLAAQNLRLRDFAPLQTRQVALLMRQRRWSEFVGFVPQLTGALVRAAILLGGGWLIVRGEWQIGSLIAFLSYVGMMVGPMQNLLGLYHAQAVAQVALVRLSDLADPDADERGGGAPAGGPGVLRLVKACGMTCRHQPVDVTIAAGDLVFVDGPSGVGKSTLVALLARLASPAPGTQILLDGEDIAGLEPVALRRKVAIVPQAVTLFRGTVGQNLRLADPHATDKRIREALALVASPVAAETMVEEAGRNLSGGERQRIALARALLLPFRALVMDECLSEVDGTTARAILAAIRKRFADRTMIVIAHAGPARELLFDQTLLLKPDWHLRSSRGGTPHQREKARENAV